MAEDDVRGVSIDPVCGRPVAEEEAERLEYKERRYFFCSARCRGRFERQAERFLEESGRKAIDTLFERSFGPAK